MFLYFFSIEHFPIIVKIESDILFCAFSMQIHQKPNDFSNIYQFLKNQRNFAKYISKSFVNICFVKPNVL